MDNTSLVYSKFIVLSLYFIEKCADEFSGSFKWNESIFESCRCENI